MKNISFEEGCCLLAGIEIAEALIPVKHTHSTQALSNMLSNMLSIQNILYPTDFSPTAQHALEHARFLAEQYDATLHAVHVFDAPLVPILIDTGAHVDKLREENDLLMRALREKVQSGEPSITLKTEIIADTSASTVDHILTYSDTHDIDLIIIGTHGRRGPKRLLMGSVAEAVVREASRPVFTVRGTEASSMERRPQRILVPVDFSDYGHYALAHAKELAATFQARLDVLHVIEHPSMVHVYLPRLSPAGLDVTAGLPATNQEDLEAHVRRTMEEMVNDVNGPEVDVAYYLGRGHASSAIIDFAEAQDIDLVVMASHGLSGLERFLLGSVTERVMRAAPCPILIVKASLQTHAETASTALGRHQQEATTN